MIWTNALLVSRLHSSQRELAEAFSPLFFAGFGKNITHRRQADSLSAQQFVLCAGLIICLPIVVLNYELVITTGHGDADVFIYRAIVASTIAASMAGLVGRRLAEQLLTIN